MDPNNRFHLNLPGQGYNNDRQYSANNARVYPTTPSTFPQPVFANQGGQATNDYLGSQMQNHQSSAAYGGGGGGGGGYFNNAIYQSQYGQSKQNQFQQQYQPNVASPQPSYQQRQAYNTNDPNSGLAHQLSTQNLGPTPRQPSPLGRHPSPIQRPRTAGTPVQQNASSQHVPASASASNLSVLGSPATNDEPPEKNPEKYSSNVARRGQGLHVLVEAFFTENIGRARDRNVR